MALWCTGSGMLTRWTDSARHRDHRCEPVPMDCEKTTGEDFCPEEIIDDLNRVSF